MKNVLRFSIVLGAIAIAAGLGVSAVYQLTRGRIEAKKEKAFAAALSSVFPEADSFAASVGQETAWEGDGVGVALKDGGAIGYLAVGERQGYSSLIRVLVGAKPDFTIRAVRILEQSETPGLGERTKEVKTDRTVWQALGEVAGLLEKERQSGENTPWFQKQFESRTLDRLVVVKGAAGDGIQAITGATVSSAAVTEAVKDALVRMQTEVTGTVPAAAEGVTDAETGASPEWEGDGGEETGEASEEPAGAAGEDD